MCATHLEASGGPAVADTSAFWRDLCGRALSDHLTFHWHAETSRRAWASVHAHDEARRADAFAAAAAAGVSGPYVARFGDVECTHADLRRAFSGRGVTAVYKLFHLWGWLPGASRSLSTIALPIRTLRPYYVPSTNGMIGWIFRGIITSSSLPCWRRLRLRSIVGPSLR